MKNHFRICLVFLLLIAMFVFLPSPAFAFIQEDGSFTPPQGEITEIPDSYLKPAVAYRNSATLFPAGATESEVIAALPDVVVGVIGASGANVPCDVAWTIPDTSTPGWITATGTLSAPPGCTLAAGLENIFYPVMIYTQNMQPVEAVQQVILFNNKLETYLAEMLPPNTDLSVLKFPSLPSTILCTNGQHYKVPVDWDLSSVDPQTPGVYPVTGQPVFPPCFRAPDGFSGLSATVYIGDPTKLDLSMLTQKSSSGFTCEWLPPLGDLENTRFYYSINSEQGPFVQDKLSMRGAQVNTTYALYSKNKIMIKSSDLQKNTDYYFYLEDDTLRSNLLYVRIDDQGYTKVQGIGGDRDGSDRNPIASSSPSPTASPAPSASPALPPTDSVSSSPVAAVPVVTATTSPSHDQYPTASPSANNISTPFATASAIPQAITGSDVAASTSSSDPIDDLQKTKPQSSDPSGKDRFLPHAENQPRPADFPVWGIILSAIGAVILVLWALKRYQKYGS